MTIFHDWPADTFTAQVNYFDEPKERSADDFGAGKRKSVQKNTDYISLECVLPSSYPQVEAIWYVGRWYDVCDSSIESLQLRDVSRHNTSCVTSSPDIYRFLQKVSN